MKKLIINLILAVCTAGLVWSVYESIYSDIRFDEEKVAREKQVQDVLMKIKDAEEMYKKAHRGEFCGTIDSLIDYIKNDRAIKDIQKLGSLTDEIQAQGYDDEESAIRAGLIKTDTVWVSAAELLGISNPDSLKFLPCGRKYTGEYYEITSSYSDTVKAKVYYGAIELRKKAAYNPKSQEFDMLLEVRARLDDYMDGVDAKRIKNLKADLKKRNRNHAELMLDNEDDYEGEWYGLRIGDLSDPSNKLAGNWE